MERRAALKRKDMHIVRQLFAIRFVPGGSNGLIELYVEDDESYGLAMTFDRAWLPDLIATATAGQQKFGLPQRTTKEG